MSKCLRYFFLSIFLLYFSELPEFFSRPVSCASDLIKREQAESSVKVDGVTENSSDNDEDDDEGRNC